MTKTPGLNALLLFAFSILATAGCGGSTPPPKDAEDEEFDLVASIVGDVDPVEAEAETTSAPEVYTGPVSATINLRVINEKSPRGTFKLTNAEGNVVIEKEKIGATVELSPGVYSIEFHTPDVFGKPAYVVEDIEIEGKEMAVDNIFPAGQITLHTFRGQAKGRCIAVPFTVKSETLGEKLKGKGKTCEPLVLETGAYEVLMNVSSKKTQPVSLKINREQVSEVAIKLE